MIENKIKQISASINTNLPTNHTKIVNIECWGNDSELIYSVLGPNTDKQTHNFKAQQPLSSPEL